MKAMTNVKKNKKGFTLVELIVVIAILAILAGILIPLISGYIKRANYSKNLANAKSIYNAAAMALSTNPDLGINTNEGQSELEKAAESLLDENMLGNTTWSVEASVEDGVKKVDSATYDGIPYPEDSSLRPS